MLTKSYDLATASLDRYKSAATAVQTLAAALGAIYTGALALVFGKDTSGLPARSLLAPAFFAIALILSLMYTSSIKPVWNRQERPPLWDKSAEEGGFDKLDSYRRLVADLVTRNIGYLHGAVAALGLAVALAPAAFVSATTSASATTDWPAPSTSATAGPDFELYKARLKEAADSRAAELRSPGPFYSIWDVPWLIVGGVGMILILVWVWQLNKAARSRAIEGVHRG